MTNFLYGLTVIIWGTTWIAISLQNGSVDTVVSIFYRFALAGLTLFFILLLSGRLQKTRLNDHLWFLIQGCCLFCFNFICIYTASKSMTSGLVSIIFSISIFFNAFNNWLFWRTSPPKSIFLAGMLGITGLVFLFWQELATNSASQELFFAVAIAMLGTYFFSLGNMVSVRLHKQSIDTLTSNSYGMSYGAMILLIIIAISHTPMTWDNSETYLYSLIYLAIPGSMIGFAAYLLLVKRIGANQAAYATVLFPVVALIISSIFEDYRWGLLNSTGLVFVLLGNAVALNLFKKKPKLFRAGSVLK